MMVIVMSGYPRFPWIAGSSPAMTSIGPIQVSSPGLARRSMVATARQSRPRRTLAACCSASALQRAFHQPLEEQLLGEGEGEDARRDDDDIDRGEVGPGPIALAALRGGEHDRHRS